MAGFSATDEMHMRRALALARNAFGWASPNPAVGCVIVNQGEVVGEGWTQDFGGPHAEPTALNQAGGRAKGATAYVTLMPCAHFGKTPTCTRALISAAVGRVVVAIDDPNPASLDGAAEMRSAGIAVDVGLLRKEALLNIAGFVKHLRTGLPLVRLKFAMSLDGRIATAGGESAWISCPQSRAEVHRLRMESDAVLVGSGTAVADNPKLNVRLDEPQPEERIFQPRRVVIDSTCRFAAARPINDISLLNTPGGEVIVVTTQASPEKLRQSLQAAGARILLIDDADGYGNLESALKALAQFGVRNIFCEGGSGLAGALVAAGLADELIAYIAPLIIGGQDAPGPIGGAGILCMKDALRLSAFTCQQVGSDFRLRGRIGKWDWLFGQGNP